MQCLKYENLMKILEIFFKRTCKKINFEGNLINKQSISSIFQEFLSFRRKNGVYLNNYSQLHKKLIFPWKISSVDVPKTTVSHGFGHIY